MTISLSVRLLYRWTIAYGLLGALIFFFSESAREALAFLLGAAGSFGNLWLFNRLARNLEPSPTVKKPWEAGAFIARYLLLFGVGYVIVKGLGVNPLPVVLGLFASTAAVLTSSIFELLQSLFSPGPPAH
jgi:hypothetical protein